MSYQYYFPLRDAVCSLLFATTMICQQNNNNSNNKINLGHVLFFDENKYMTWES